MGIERAQFPGEETAVFVPAPLIIWSHFAVGGRCLSSISPPEGTATATAAGIAVPQPTIPPTTTPAYTPAFETAECQFSHPATVEITCGYLIVPENRADPQRMIRLHVAVISSYSAAPAPDPLVFLDGGPGDYTLDKAGG